MTSDIDWEQETCYFPASDTIEEVQVMAESKESVLSSWFTIDNIAVGSSAVGVVAAGTWNAIAMVAISFLNAIGLVSFSPVNAVGFVAIGGVNAVGVVAIGGINSVGVISIGGVGAYGVIAIGGGTVKSALPLS